MKTEDIIKTLQEHNDWRRGIGKWSDREWYKANYFDTISPYELGQTIDAAIERLQTLEMERDEARHEAEEERLNAWNITSHKSGWVNFSWEDGNE